MDVATRMKILADYLRNGSRDPRWTASGQQLPPQAVLDQPVPGAAPPQQPMSMIAPASGIEGAVDPMNKAASLRALIEQRMREQEAAGNYQ